ncbi:unnamed protein product, partial [Discosporangium mesarthrocarpum]
MVEDTAGARALQRPVQAFVSSCHEPTVCRAGRLLTERAFALEHVGCASRKLEQTLAVGLGILGGEAAGVQEAVAAARRLVCRYAPQSRAASRLRECCILKGIVLEESLWRLGRKDCSWWSVYTVVEGLLRMREAVRLHEHVDGLAPAATEEHWTILSMLLPKLDPLVETRKMLEDHDSITSSLVIPFLHDLLGDLRTAVKDFEGKESRDSSSTSSDTLFNMRVCCQQMLGNFESWWGDGNVVTPREGRGDAPVGFSRGQVLATALDPRTKVLYGIPEEEHPAVWDMVVMEAMTTLEARRAAGEDTTTPEPPPRAVAPGAGAGLGWGARGAVGIGAGTGARAGAAVGVGAGAEGDESAMVRSRLRQSAQLELSAFREAPGMPMYDHIAGDRGGGRVKLDPLQWWARRVKEFPILARVARRVLATPATQAQAEGAFLSGSGPDGAPLSPEQLPGAAMNLPHTDLLVYLRNTWPTVDKW